MTTHELQRRIENISNAELLQLHQLNQTYEIQLQKIKTEKEIQFEKYKHKVNISLIENGYETEGVTDE